MPPSFLDSLLDLVEPVDGLDVLWQQLREQRYLGRLEEVLVEGRNVKRPTQVTGRTRGNRIVFFDGDADTLVGKLVDVRITEPR